MASHSSAQPSEFVPTGRKRKLAEVEEPLPKRKVLKKGGRKESQQSQIKHIYRSMSRDLVTDLSPPSQLIKGEGMDTPSRERQKENANSNPEESQPPPPDDGYETEGTLRNEEGDELGSSVHEEDKRPWDDRLYREHGDDSTSPTVITGRDLVPGGFYIDIETGESLSVATCCAPPDMYAGLSDDERRTAMETYKREIVEASYLPLPDEDDVDVDSNFADM
ncbi:hypothetical protein B0O99DRAFT_594799 [Bisporella sp. PMI_857]|nr:hypothetical protein B0O99DRAFT_594799 [Bisporella sp. PMI_857]